MKKQEYRKNEEGLGNLLDTFKHSTIWIIGMPKGEEEEQEIENLFGKNNEEKFPQSGEGNRHRSRGIAESQTRAHQHT